MVSYKPYVTTSSVRQFCPASNVLIWFLCNAVLDNIQESNEDILGEELMKTKQKLKDITSALETQHMLLRLVVQVREVYF